jgi:hypothetical protein
MWTPRFPVAELRAGQTLCVCLPARARVRFGTDGWQRVDEVATGDSTLGLHVADIPSAPLRPGQRIQFTIYWTGSSSWEGRNYEVRIR